MIDLRGGIQVDIKLSLHESCGCLFELRRSIVHVTAILGAVRLDLQFSPYLHVRHRVVFTDAEVEQESVRVVRERLAFRPFDFLELVNFVGFTVLRSPDPIGEQFLEVGVS
jgi:hypothetical protein